MRILHVITSLWTGGAEKLMVDLLPRLRDIGYEVDLLTFNGDQTPFRTELQSKGINVYDFGNGESLASLYSPLNILRLIPFMRKYDVVHTHNTAPQLFAAIAGTLGRAKLITTEHNTSNRRRGSRVMASIDKLMYQRYSHIICISDKAEENLREHLGRINTEISTINNGVDIDLFAKAESNGELERLAPNSTKIVMVAGFRAQKDQDTLIKSLRYFPDRFNLFLVGDGERRAELENLAKKMNLTHRVHFLGIRTDIPQLLHEADYVVMSSHFEGLSLSSVEGMSVGKPFIASDVDGLREVVDGAGVLFAHQDAEGLAKEILKLDANPEIYEEVADICLERAKQYDISKMVDSYHKLYSEILKQKCQKQYRY